jgi:hypothetical protein
VTRTRRRMTMIEVPASQAAAVSVQLKMTNGRKLLKQSCSPGGHNHAAEAD